MVPIIFFSALFLIIAAVLIGSRKIAGKKVAGKGTPEERLEKEPEYTERRALLIKTRCGVDVRGTKQVYVTKKYFITFELEDGQISEFQVDEEIYNLLEEGMTGNLVTVEGNFFGFEAEN